MNEKLSNAVAISCSWGGNRLEDLMLRNADLIGLFGLVTVALWLAVGLACDYDAWTQDFKDCSSTPSPT